MEYSEQVVEVLSKAVVKALDQRLAEYDTQIDKKLRRYVFGTENLMPLSVTGEQIAQGSVVGSNIANGTITGANILAMTITGDLLVDGTLTGVKIKDGAISTKKLVSKEVETDVMNAVIANIANANIDWANVKTLNADNAVIVKAVVEQLEAESVTTGNLVASLAEVGTAIIKDATIDAAHIKDLKANVALIDRSVEGKTFIRDLSVSDANIVSLLVNKLFVQDGDKTYNVFINSEFDPEVLTPEERKKMPILTRVQVDGSGVMEDSLPAGALVRNSITTSELNAGEIFADEAFVNSLTAGIGNFGTLFANEAIIGQLKTHLIQSDYMTFLIQDEISREWRENLLTGAVETEKSVTLNGQAYYQIGGVDFTSINGLTSGKHVVFRTHLRPTANMWRAMLVFTYPSGTVPSESGLVQMGLKWVSGLGAVAYSDQVVVSNDGDWATVTSIIPPNANAVRTYIQNTGSTSDKAYYHSPKLEEGTVPTAWEKGFDPENWDTIKNTVMTLDRNGFLLSAGQIHLTGGSMLFEASTNMTMKSGAGITMNSGAAMTLQSGSTMTLQAGSTMTLQGSTLNLIAKTNADGTKTDAVLNIQSGGALNIQSGGSLSIESDSSLAIVGSTVSITGESTLEIDGSDVSICAGNLSIMGGGIEIKNAGGIYSYILMEGGYVKLIANSSFTVVGSYIDIGDSEEPGYLNVYGGEINIYSRGAFKVSTGGKFSVDAEDDSSYIRFGGSPDSPNFMLGNQGIVKAVSGIFDRLTVGGRNIVAADGNSLSDKIIVSESQPTGEGQHGIIWIHPTGSSGGGGSTEPVGTVDYTFDANAHNAVYFNGYTATNSVIFNRSGSAIGGDKCSYGIKLTIYNYDEKNAAGQCRVTVKIQRASGGNEITIMENMAVGWVGKTGYLYVDTLNSPTKEDENMTDASDIKVTVTISKSASTVARYEYFVMTLRCKSVSGTTTYSTTSGGNQNCEIIYIP